MNASTDIIAVRSLLPERAFDAAAIEAAFMRWLADRPEEDRLKARRILRNSGVAVRRSCLELDEIFEDCGLTRSSVRFREHAVRLGEELLASTLEQAGCRARDLDVLVTTSCTGFMIPSIDAHLAERFGMRSDLLRLPVTQMGCAAGASALMYASEMLAGRPGGTAAILNVELPTNTMQLHDFSMDNIVSSALFSDGLGCTILRRATGAERRDAPASILGWTTHQVPGSLDLLGYHLTGTGFSMQLDPTLPDVIARHFESAARSLLGPRGLTLGDIDHFVIHPGGVKILDRIEPILAAHGGSTALSRAVMRDCGNMSSATVIVILERLLASRPKPGRALLMSFGPGFGAHQVLLDIGKETQTP
jgi:predicted naringenin-chalcone synthase